MGSGITLSMTNVQIDHIMWGAPDLDAGISEAKRLFGVQAALSALVPLIGGLLADQWGLASVFYFLAATMLVANLLVVALPHHDPADRRE